MKVNKSKKVIVAMSGGVDSSVAAALLKRAGFNLLGVFMKFWSEPLRGSTRINADSNADLRGYENRCCSLETEKRARKVAQILGIPFYVFNFEKEFKKRIVDYFLAEYKAGRTPNPCVVCNKEIKFGLLLEKVLALGADFVATGHYAHRSPSGFGGKTMAEKQLTNFTRVKNVNYKLLRAKDKKKDQSYFLWQLEQKQLKHILFPIGDYTKPQVRRMAKKLDLLTAKTPESQEVCFIKNTTEEFLRKYLKERPGDIITLPSLPPDKSCDRKNCQILLYKYCDRKKCKVVGEHKGLWFYTIGQRKGIGLPGGPYYAVGKDTKKNLLIVSKNEKDLGKKELIAEKVNWISGKPPKLPLRVRAKIRYKTVLDSAIIKKSGSKYKIIFNKPQRAITPGQSVVWYQGNELLGGGVIQ